MNLREWRKSEKLSQEQVGRKLGFGDQWKTYQPYESGRTVPDQGIKDKLEKMGYRGPYGKAQFAPAGPTREEFAALQRENEILRKDVKSVERVQGALIGAVRQLAKAAGLSHLAESLE